MYPSYNEEANVQKTLEKSLTALKPRFARFEIIVVDDASTDRTPVLLKEYAAEHAEIKIIRHERNEGAGKSMLEGMMAARMALIVNNAMDYPFDLCDLSRMCAALDRADVVVAARRGRPGYSLYRHFLSLANRALLRCMFGLPLRDCNFVQLYRKQVLDEIEVVSSSAGFLPAELLIRAHDRGYRLVEVDVEYHAREAGTSVMGHPKVALRSLIEMLSFRFPGSRRRRGTSA